MGNLALEGRSQTPEQRTHLEVEWERQRTAGRRIRTEERMLWVSSILFFHDPRKPPKGLLEEGTVCNARLGRTKKCHEILQPSLHFELCEIYTLEVTGCFRESE